MNIRIGNDICLYVNLLDNRDFDILNIHSIEAFLINTTKWLNLMEEEYRETALMQDEINCRKDKIKFVSRFPVEPHFPGFHPTPYDVCCTGHPCYHLHPIPYIPIYHGYGVHPHTFEHDCFGPCAWHTNHPHNLHHHCEPHTWRCDDMHDLIDRAGFKHLDMQKLYDLCHFIAPIEATNDKDTIKVYFPAKAQLYTGTYKLVIVAKLFEPGYCKSNLRTITIDYEDVFTLVESSSHGVDGNITIRVGTNKLYADEIRQVRMGSDRYTIIKGNELSFGEADYTGQAYKLIVDLKDGSSVEYNPGDWEFGSITFDSMKPDEVGVNQHSGKLTAIKRSDIEDLPIINVYDAQHNLMTSFEVKVVGEGCDYIVFMNTKINEENPSEDFGDADINKVHDYIIADNVERSHIEAEQRARICPMTNIFGTKTLNNPGDGNYMWIVTRDPIADSNTTHSSIKVSMFDVPLYDWNRNPDQPQIYKYNDADHLYYHVCPNPLMSTNYDITIESK